MLSCADAVKFVEPSPIHQIATEQFRRSLYRHLLPADSVRADIPRADQQLYSALTKLDHPLAKQSRSVLDALQSCTDVSPCNLIRCASCTPHIHSRDLSAVLQAATDAAYPLYGSPKTTYLLTLAPAAGLWTAPLHEVYDLFNRDLPMIMDILSQYDIYLAVDINFDTQNEFQLLELLRIPIKTRNNEPHMCAKSPRRDRKIYDRVRLPDLLIANFRIAPHGLLTGKHDDSIKHTLQRKFNKHFGHDQITVDIQTASSKKYRVDYANTAKYIGYASKLKVGKIGFHNNDKKKTSTIFEINPLLRVSFFEKPLMFATGIYASATAHTSKLSLVSDLSKLDRLEHQLIMQNYDHLPEFDLDIIDMCRGLLVKRYETIRRIKAADRVLDAHGRIVVSSTTRDLSSLNAELAAAFDALHSRVLKPLLLMHLQPRPCYDRLPQLPWMAEVVSLASQAKTLRSAKPLKMRSLYDLDQYFPASVGINIEAKTKNDGKWFDLIAKELLL